MKKIIFLFGLSISLFSNCKEEPIVIPPLGNNGNNGNTDIVEKHILVEEYTGAGCVNCPDGAAILNDLKTNVYKDKMAVVSIHAGFFTKKSQLPKESLYDFTTPNGNALQLFLGEPVGYPAAIINRKVRDNTTNSMVVESKDQWASLIQAEAKEKAEVKMTVKTFYNGTTRDLKVTSTFEPLVNLTGKYAYTIMITEDNILDAQKTPTGVKADYVHRHVLRDILTPVQGMSIEVPLTKGKAIEQELFFPFKLPSNWKSQNCEVIVVMHKVGNSKEVVQVAEKNIE